MGASEMLGGSNDKRAAKGLVTGITGHCSDNDTETARPAAAAGRLDWDENG
jgi:hypothetical protein